MAENYMGFPKIWVTLLGVPIIRIIVFFGSILGSLYFGQLPYVCVLLMDEILHNLGALNYDLRWCKITSSDSMNLRV